MIEWNVYESNKEYGNRRTAIKSTLRLILWLIFNKHEYIVTINKRKHT